MTGTAMRSHKNVKIRSGSVSHMDLAVMSVPLANEGKYFVTCVYEASGHDSLCYKSTKREATHLFMWHAHLVDYKNYCRVYNTVVVGGKKYVKKEKELETNGINICDSENYTPGASRRAERITCIITNEMRTISLHSSAASIL